MEGTLCGNKMRNWNLYITVYMRLVLNMNFAFNPPSIKPSLSLIYKSDCSSVHKAFLVFLCQFNATHCQLHSF